MTTPWPAPQPLRNRETRGGWIERNPADYAHPPKLTRRRAAPPSPQQVARLLNAAAATDDELAVFLWLAVTTGARRGELVALRWSDLDLERGVLRLASNYVVRSGQRQLKGTKTGEERLLSLDAATVGVLTDLHAARAAALARVALRLPSDAFVLTPDPSGARPWHPDHFTHAQWDGVRLLLKRDDLINADVPGNKWRKLKYNLADAAASGKHTLLTFGGAYSNHIRAVAAAGYYFGFETIGVIRGEEHLPLNPALDYAVRHGMTLDYLDRTTYRDKSSPAVEERLRQLRRLLPGSRRREQRGRGPWCGGDRARARQSMTLSAVLAGREERWPVSPSVSHRASAR